MIFRTAPKLLCSGARRCPTAFVPAHSKLRTRSERLEAVERAKEVSALNEMREPPSLASRIHEPFVLPTCEESGKPCKGYCRVKMWNSILSYSRKRTE
jgi:hypothetical protein